jgi:hypothetical protein
MYGSYQNDISQVISLIFQAPTNTNHVNLASSRYCRIWQSEMMWWKGRAHNNDELHETFFDALGPTFIFHFANNNLGDKPILSFIYSLFD